ncbi:MAG TPA: aromatic amino acid transport family protein [Candidatus Colwellbacteria bacterium]|nr:aromatic amino acid transport family protein [Candidatus Colwellbacteria bacterium]
MKFSRSYKEIVVPACMLASLIIGAGMFSLPYVTSRSGILAGLFYLLAFTGVMSLIHVFYGDIVIADKSGRRFASQSRHYLGRKGFLIGAVSLVAGTTLALTIYLILAEGFAKLMFPGFSVSVILFWVLGSAGIALGIKGIAGLNNLLTLFMVLLAGTVAFFGLKTGAGFWRSVPLWPRGDIALWLLPIGPFLFSLSGRGAIASIEDYFEANRLDIRKMKKAIVWGTLGAAAVYLLFIVGMLGITAGAPARDIMIDLALLPGYLKLLVAGLGLIAVFTSYVFLGLELKMVLEKDFRLRGNAALAAVVVAPIAIYFAASRDLVSLISVAGGVFIALESAIVILMWEKLKSKRFWLNRLIVFAFVVGALYEIFKRTI